MSGHVVVITGGRSYPNELRRVVEASLNARYARYGNFTLIHGACGWTLGVNNVIDQMTGADRYADDWAQTAPGVDLRRRPADWDRYDKQAGPRRNEAMVLEALELASPEQIHGLAFPEPRSRGTWNCVRHMEDHGIHVDKWDVPRARKWLEAPWAA